MVELAYPFLIFYLVAFTASGNLEITGPLPSEAACEHLKAQVIVGVQVMQEEPNWQGRTILGCARVSLNPEKDA